VSNWDRVPAERVLSVESATGVARSVLRPDLYNAASDAPDDVDAARAREYALLATLLGRPPDAQLLGRLARLRGDAGGGLDRQNPLGRNAVPVRHRGLRDANAARQLGDAAGRTYRLVEPLIPHFAYFLCRGV